MGIHGYPWMSMDIHGYPLISMDTHGYPWISMDIHGYPWISMDIHGSPWIGHMIPTGFGYGYSQSRRGGDVSIDANGFHNLSTDLFVTCH